MGRRERDHGGRAVSALDAFMDEGAKLAVWAHSSALVTANMLGRMAASEGIQRAQNPFSDLPPIHPLRECWDHEYDLTVAEGAGA
jgi:hypothetical protein